MDSDPPQLSDKSKDELVALAIELKNQLLRTQQKNRRLEHELLETRNSQIAQQNQTEAEEEFIANTLFKKLSDLSKTKSELMRKVEMEEEYLTNTLQKKLDEIQKEKFKLEQQLEFEEELIVNKLQKQLQELQEEKGVLEQMVSDDAAQAEELRKKKIELEKFSKEKSKEISNLESENFGLNQQILKISEKIKEISEKNSKIESDVVFKEEISLSNKSPSPLSASLASSLSVHVPSTSEKIPIISPRRKSSLSTFEIKKRLLEGWFRLSYEGKSQHRYVIINDEVLCGFLSEELLATGNDTIIIHLDRITKVTRKSPSEFDVTVSRGPTYNFQSSESVEKWVSLLDEFVSTE